MLFPMIRKIFTFLEKKNLPYWGDLMTSYHVTTKITKMSPLLFFFSLFPHKKHFYEQNVLVTRLLERDYIWVLTIAKIFNDHILFQEYTPFKMSILKQNFFVTFCCIVTRISGIIDR